MRHNVQSYLHHYLRENVDEPSAEPNSLFVGVRRRADGTVDRRDVLNRPERSEFANRLDRAADKVLSEIQDVAEPALGLRLNRKPCFGIAEETAAALSEWDKRTEGIWFPNQSQTVAGHAVQLDDVEEVLLRAFCGVVNERIQCKLGMDEYVWETRGDNRLCHDHDARQGRIFEWDSPPDGLHPRYVISCDCIARPYLAEVDDVYPTPRELAAFEDQRLDQHLRAIATSTGGRGAGSATLRRSASWAKRYADLLDKQVEGRASDEDREEITLLIPKRSDVIEAFEIGLEKRLRFTQWWSIRRLREMRAIRKHIVFLVERAVRFEAFYRQGLATERQALTAVADLGDFQGSLASSRSPRHMARIFAERRVSPPKRGRLFGLMGFFLR